MRAVYFFIAVLLLFTFSATGQNNQVLYFMNLPQNHLVNPAFRPESRVYVGLPVISGIDLNIGNTIFNFSDIFREGVKTSKSTIPFMNEGYDVNKLMKRIKKNNYFDTRLSLQLLGVGFTLKDNLYIFLDVSDRFSSNFNIPGDLFELAFRGNDKFYGTTVDLTSFTGNISYYRETGVGFSKNFGDKLRFGVKGKLLFGIASASVENNLLSISVADDNSHKFDTDMALNISAPVRVLPKSSTDDHIDQISFDEDRFDNGGDYAGFMTNTKNLGFGLDLGAEFRVTDQIVASAALTDLGFIKWKSDLARITTENQIDFSGMNMEEVYNGTSSFSDVSEAMVDSVKSSLLVDRSPKPFTTFLPSGFAIGGRYDINRMFSAGLLSYTRFSGKRTSEALTVSGNLNLNNFLSATLAYTASNRNYDHLGFGFAIRGLFAQLYVLFDNVPLTWSKVNTGGDSFAFPDKWNTLHVFTGFNLLFGNRHEKQRK